MWMHPSIRDLLEPMVSALPDTAESPARTRDEMLTLLVALFGPAEGEPDAAMRARIAAALDAIMAERAARRIQASALPA